jgi:regulator of RNase E activity RraA
MNSEVIGMSIPPGGVVAGDHVGILFVEDSSNLTSN